ncbi:venom serine protease [Drosophila ficusphila]|uniref:venom serine protease n=1 Tax=Drosophila ficusphila TaxID=30025 RepID=UPI0007E78254|nr:venom serine protease [Drosophila ficusphila]
MAKMFNRCLISLLLLAPAVSAYFEGCDNTYNLNAGTTYVESPYYPSNYPGGTSCRYKFVAPLDYYIQVQCNIALPSNNGQCNTDNFWVDQEGDPLMRSAENFCGSGSFSRESLFTELVFAYISTGTSGGNFKCALTVTKQNCNCGWSATARIANGQQAAANEFPSFAALKDVTKNQASFCGGTIVAHRYILTAAHCIYMVSQATNIVAIVGTNNLNNPSSSVYYQQYSIQQMIPHEQYVSDPNVNNDIAVLITATNIKWSRGVGPICLPPVGTTSPFTYDTVDVIGFGTLIFAGPTSATLQKINLNIVTNQDCQTEYNNVATIYTGQMCTYDYSGTGRDSCQFDSGGPVILRKTRQFLVGIISFGKSCAESQYPMGVNTRVTSYISWIRQKIGNSNCVVSL